MSNPPPGHGVDSWYPTRRRASTRCRPWARCCSFQTADTIAVGTLGVDDGVELRCHPQRALDLLAAMAMWAGLRIDHEELGQDVLVVKLLPVPKS